MSERLNLLALDVRANPYPRYAELRRAAPVCQVDPGGLWAVSRYDDVAFVIKNAELFSSQGLRFVTVQPWLEHNPLTDSILLMDAPQHTKTRALVTRAFGARVIPRIEPLVRAVARDFVERLSPGRELDFCAELALSVPATAMSNLLGLDPALGARFRHWADDIVSVNASATPERIESIRKTIADIERYLQEVMAARRAAPRDDLVSDLLAAELDGVALTDAEIVSFLTLLLGAGLETTTHLLAHSLRVLMDRPDVRDRVRGDPWLLPAFIEETLRIEPPVHARLRLATADVTLHGVTMPKGSFVAALVGSANRDEAQFPDPDRFDLDRPRQTGLSFGSGAHFCLGAALARAEARIALEALTALPGHFEPLDRPLDWNLSITVRGPRELWVRYVA